MLKIRKISSIKYFGDDSSAGFWKISKRGFLLKFLEQKGLLDSNSTKKNVDVRKIETIDLKDLLNEKNMRISIFDIFTDYRNFRREYYTFSSESIKNDNTKLSFERKDTNIKNIIYYFLFQVKDHVFKTLGQIF